MKPDAASPRRTILLPLLTVGLVCLLGLAFTAGFASLNTSGWGIDFNQFYSASQLAGTGHLYDWDALRKIESAHGAPVRSGRLPVELYGFKLLGHLPYATARYVWMAACVAALLLFACAWPGARPVVMLVALCWSVPAALVLLYGQDDPFWLMSFAAGLLLLDRKRPWLAGVAFSLCLCKVHLAAGIPVMLLARRNWKTLAAGAVSLAVWFSAGYLIEGSPWLRRYTAYVHVPEFSPAPYRMPNLRGIACWLPWPTAVELLGAAAVVWLLWRVCRRRDIGLAGAAAAACGLLLGHHGYADDCVLLIPLAVFAVQRPDLPRWLKLWAVALISSAPVWLLLSPKPWLGQWVMVGFVGAALAVCAARSSSPA